MNQELNQFRKILSDVLCTTKRARADTLWGFHLSCPAVWIQRFERYCLIQKPELWLFELDSYRERASEVPPTQPNPAQKTYYRGFSPPMHLQTLLDLIGASPWSWTSKNECLTDSISLLVEPTLFLFPKICSFSQLYSLIQVCLLDLSSKSTVKRNGSSFGENLCAAKDKWGNYFSRWVCARSCYLHLLDPIWK